MIIHFIVATAGITIFRNYFTNKKTDSPENQNINNLYRNFFVNNEFIISNEKQKEQKYDYEKFYERLNENSSDSEKLKDAINACVEIQKAEYDKLPDIFPDKSSPHLWKDETILPVEITSIYRFVRELPQNVDFAKINRENLNEIELHIHLMSTDTFLCAAACYMLKKILEGKTEKIHQLVPEWCAGKILKIVVKEPRCVKGLIPTEKNFKKTSVNDLFSVLGAIQKDIKDIKGSKLEYILVAGVNSMIPYLTIYAQIANDIPIIIAPDKSHNLKIDALPISFDYDLAEKYKFYLQSIKNKTIKVGKCPFDIKKELLAYNLVDENFNITGMGISLERKEISSSIFGEIYANKTALWLVEGNDKAKEHFRSGDEIKTDVLYDYKNEKITENNGNGDFDILILKKIRENNKYNCVICECKTAYQALISDTENSVESKISKQIKKYASIAASINGKSKPKDYTLSGKNFCFDKIDQVIEFRLYIYATKSELQDESDDFMIKEIKAKVGEYKNIWKSAYNSAEILPEVKFSIYHIVVDKNLKTDSSFGKPIDVIDLIK